MDRNIIPLKRETAKRVFNTEWSHQLATLEQGLNFFEEYFLWSTQQLSLNAETSEGHDSPQYMQFYHSEAPMILEESREAFRILKMLTRDES